MVYNLDDIYEGYDPNRKVEALKDEFGEYWIYEGGSNIEFHREDGPALIYLDGDVEWWFNDYQLPFEYWCQATKKSEEEIVRLKLTYC